jgi:hypothetical protein
MSVLLHRIRRTAAVALTLAGIAVGGLVAATVAATPAQLPPSGRTAPG